MFGRIKAAIGGRVKKEAPSPVPDRDRIEHESDGRPSKIVEVRSRPFKVIGLDEEDPYFRSLTRDFEPDFISLCERLIAPDYVCVDVGANIGVKSLALAQFATQGRILAIEAGPGIVPLLERNIAAAGAGNVTVCHAAVSDKDGSVTFQESSAYGHISNEEGVAVPAKTLRTLIGEFGLSRVDFIKIDVEGFEFPILRDSLDEINRNQAVVLFEFNSWCQMAFAEIAPMQFARWILANFSHVYLVRRHKPAGEDLRRLLPTEARELLHTNLIEDGCVSDILVTNAPERLPPDLRAGRQSD